MQVVYWRCSNPKHAEPYTFGRGEQIEMYCPKDGHPLNQFEMQYQVPVRERDVFRSAGSVLDIRPWQPPTLRAAKEIIFMIVRRAGPPATVH